jgi:multicomponent Na+:H+ antiporter subunit F
MDGDLIGTAVYLSVLLLSTGIVLGIYRLVRGPTLADRVVALDLIATLATGAIAVYSIHTARAVVLDVAIVIALIAFVSTLALASYIEKESSR